MDAVLNITAPIFFLVLLGYLSVRFGFLPKESLPGLSRFVLYLALPALVFTKLLSMDLSEVVNFEYIFIYAAAGLTSLVFTILVSHFFFKDKWSTSGVRGVGASMSNSAFIGFPIILQFFEHAPAQTFAMAVMVENIILLPAGLIFIESMLSKGQSEGNLILPVLKRVSSNPMILTVFAGCLCSALNLQLPVFMDHGLTMLAGGSACVALIVIGGSLVGVSIKGSIGQMSLIAFSKLLVFPLVALGLSQLFPNMSNDLKIAVIIFAAVPMFSIYPVIGNEYGERTFCASALLVTTILSFFTLSLLLRFLL